MSGLTPVPPARTLTDPQLCDRCRGPMLARHGTGTRWVPALTGLCPFCAATDPEATATAYHRALNLLLIELVARCGR